MADTPQKPYVSPELLAYLDRLFPDRCSTLKDSDREVWWKAGSADVVRHLRCLANNQVKRSLESG